jgi:pimeloyl-ACP methyl ester carboxylesterase
VHRIGRMVGMVAAGVLLAGGGMVVGASPSVAGPAVGPRATALAPRPVVFVHGFFGSGSQFETQAKRFASNGYPASFVETQDYDSTSVSQNDLFNALDARISRLTAAAGVSQVDLLGHSLGTSLMQTYLNSSTARAAKVAHYVNIDGAAATALPGGVPTLNIRGEGNTGTITGATQLDLPNESHVQTTSSAESFTAEYRFFTGQDPATTDVVPETGAIQLAGNAVSFPSNVGIHNARLDVFQIDPATGRRLSPTPLSTTTFGATGTGAFGPLTASGTASYEFAITPTSNVRVHHFYFQPFRRTDLTVKLLSTDPNTGVDLLIEHNARHSSIETIRNKEWWGDQGAAGDTLTVNGTSILNASDAPRSKRAIALFLFDSGSDGRTNLTSVPGLLGLLPFISGADLFVPATSTATGTVVLTQIQRGGSGQVERVAVPNWPSDHDNITVMFDDFVK